MVQRRTPLGTEPPVSATEPAQETSGVILVPAPPGLDGEEREATPPPAVIVEIIDDDWLDRLDLAD